MQALMLAELPGAAATAAAAAATSFDQRCAVCVMRSEELTESYGTVTELFVSWHITRVLYLTYFWKKRRF